MSKKITVFQKSRVYHKGIKIPFSEIFGDARLKQYEDFDLSRKRTFHNFHDFFIQENNKLMKFDRDNEIITNYLMLKYSIDKELLESPEHFIDELFATIMKPWFLDDIEKYVERRFMKECQDIDKALHDQDGKLNPTLVFNNFHAILMFTMAVMMRFVSPLVTHFMYKYPDMISSVSVDELKRTNNAFYNNGSKKFDKTSLLLEVAKRMLETLTIKYPEVNMYGKINNYILNMIKSTEYSNAEMWNKLAMRSVTRYTLCDYIMNKILSDIIPKASFEKHIIKFMVVTIEYQTNWAINMNYHINYNMISEVQEDSDFSDADRFEINSAKLNIQKKIFNDFFADDTINILFAREGYVADAKKLQWYYENNMQDIPNIQIYLIYNFFAKHFGGCNNIDGLDYGQWIRLLVFLVDYMESRKYKILQYIMTGKVEDINAKRVLTKTIDRKIKESLRYKRIMDKYSNTGTIVAESKTIEQHIVFMLNSTISYNYYEHPNNGQIIDIDATEASDELLRFIEEL